jgi:hypothetical protein
MASGRWCLRRSCAQSADTDDSGVLDITDAISWLNHLFLGGPAPPSPYPDCDRDLTQDALSCESFVPCETDL